MSICKVFTSGLYKVILCQMLISIIFISGEGQASSLKIDNVNKAQLINIIKSNDLYSGGDLTYSFDESLDYYREYYFKDQCRDNGELNAVASTKILITRLLSKINFDGDPVSLFSQFEYGVFDWYKIQDINSEDVNVTSQVLLNTLIMIRELPSWKKKLSKFSVQEWNYNQSDVYYSIKNDLVGIKFNNECLEDIRYWLISFWSRRLQSQNIELTEKILKSYIALSEIYTKENKKKPLLIVNTTCDDCSWDFRLNNIREKINGSRSHWSEGRWTDWFSVHGGFIYDISMYKGDIELQHKEISKILNDHYTRNNIEYRNASAYRYPDGLGVTFDYMIFNTNPSIISLVSKDVYVESEYDVSAHEDRSFKYSVVSNYVGNKNKAEQLYEKLSTRVESVDGKVTFPPLSPLENFERKVIDTRTFMKRKVILCIINDIGLYNHNNEYKGECNYWAGSEFQGFIYEVFENYSI